jgi:hypothetical protein
MIAGIQQTSFGGSRLKHTKPSVPGPTLARSAPAGHHAERYRLLAQEITDPLAAGLLRDIISELEADPLEKLTEDGEQRDQKMARSLPWPAKRRSS